MASNVLTKLYKKPKRYVCMITQQSGRGNWWRIHFAQQLTLVSQQQHFVDAGRLYDSQKRRLQHAQNTKCFAAFAWQKKIWRIFAQRRLACWKPQLFHRCMWPKKKIFKNQPTVHQLMDYIEWDYQKIMRREHDVVKKIIKEQLVLIETQKKNEALITQSRQANGPKKMRPKPCSALISNTICIAWFIVSRRRVPNWPRLSTCAFRKGFTTYEKKT